MDFCTEFLIKLEKYNTKSKNVELFEKHYNYLRKFLFKIFSNKNTKTSQQYGYDKQMVVYESTNNKKNSFTPLNIIKERVTRLLNYNILQIVMCNMDLDLIKLLLEIIHFESITLLNLIIEFQEQFKICINKVLHQEITILLITWMSNCFNKIPEIIDYNSSPSSNNFVTNRFMYRNEKTTDQHSEYRKYSFPPIYKNFNYYKFFENLPNFLGDQELANLIPYLKKNLIVLICNNYEMEDNDFIDIILNNNLLVTIKDEYKSCLFVDSEILMDNLDNVINNYYH